MRIGHLRSTVVVVGIAVALGAGVGCGGSAARVQADATTTSAATSTTLNQALVCGAQKMTHFKQSFIALDQLRMQLEEAERTLAAKLNAALASNSPQVGSLQAQHGAVLRKLSDTQLRLLDLEASKPQSNSCSSTCADDPMSSTTVCKPNP
jgi:hypothetical protein